MTAIPGSPATRLTEMGLDVIHLPPPSGSAPVMHSTNLLHTFAHWPQDGARPVTGKMGLDRNVPQGRDAARLAVLAVFGTLVEVLGSLDATGQFVFVHLALNTTAEFAQHHEVADAASQLLVDVFDEGGRAVRTVVGVASLPDNHLLELSATVEV